MRSSSEEELLAAAITRNPKRKITELTKFATLDKIEIKEEGQDKHQEQLKDNMSSFSCNTQKKNKRENLKLLTNTSSIDIEDGKAKSKTPHPTFSTIVGQGLFTFPPKENDPFQSISNFHLYGVTYDVSMRECNRPHQQDRVIFFRNY